MSPLKRPKITVSMQHSQDNSSHTAIKLAKIAKMEEENLKMFLGHELKLDTRTADRLKLNRMQGNNQFFFPGVEPQTKESLPIRNFTMKKADEECVVSNASGNSYLQTKIA